MTPDEVVSILKACEPVSVEGQSETVNDFKMEAVFEHQPELFRTQLPDRRRG